jgi:hypothetical protein
VEWNPKFYFFSIMHHVHAMQCVSSKDPEKWAELTMKLPITELFVQATTILEQFLYQK